MKNHSMILFVLALLAAGMQPVTAQERELNLWSSRLDSMLMHLQALQAAQEQAARQADSLAVRIQALKSKHSANVVEARELEYRLRVSQEVAAHQQQIQRQTATTLHALVRFSEATLKNLNKMIDALTAQLAHASRPEERARLAASLHRATELRRRCLQYAGLPPQSIPIIDVQIEADDTPAQIEAKADFLLDQADRLQSAAARMAKKIDELRDELRLRNRLADFVDDLAAFDPGNELVQSNTRSGTAALNATGESSGERVVDVKSGAPEITATAQVTPASILLEPQWPANTTTLTSAELEAWISKLAQQRRQALHSADSLKHQAEAFRTLLKKNR